MQEERWREIVGQIKDSFEVEDSGIEESDEQGGTTVEFIVFSGPLGRLRLEYETHPLILDTKTHYSKRIGSETEVEYIYSATEKTSHLSIYKYDDAKDEWRPFETQAFAS